MTKPSELAIKIVKLRNQKGMTQKELAELCNVDIRTIQRIESGEVAPRKHTLKLLASILDYDLNTPATNPEKYSKEPIKGLKPAFIAGLIFSINAIPVVFDIITHAFNDYLHVATVFVHIVTCIFFYRGFYLLGGQNKNQIMEISFLLAMILLPLINVMELLKPYYFNSQLTSTIFTLLCINGIFAGLGLFLQTYQRKSDNKMNYYKIGGVITIIENGMFLSSNFNLIYGGLILSLGSNLLLITILYSEYADTARKNMQESRHALG